MQRIYYDWLKQQEYSESSIATRTSHLKKVEDNYGDIDEIIQQGLVDKIINELRYTAEDERRHLPNPSKIPLSDGVNIRNNLASYKNAIGLYLKFLEQSSDLSLDQKLEESISKPSINLPIVDSERQKISLERDMQIALRRKINTLGKGFEIIDDGIERVVDSGRIDISCKDGEQFVVIELKAGKTDSSVIGQILGYMGDVQTEEQSDNITGIIVAHEFDRRTISAARAVPNLKLVKYEIEFNFEYVN